MSQLLLLITLVVALAAAAAAAAATTTTTLTTTTNVTDAGGVAKRQLTADGRCVDWRRRQCRENSGLDLDGFTAFTFADGTPGSCRSTTTQSPPCDCWLEYRRCLQWADCLEDDASFEQGTRSNCETVCSVGGNSDWPSCALATLGKPLKRFPSRALRPKMKTLTVSDDCTKLKVRFSSRNHELLSRFQHPTLAVYAAESARDVARTHRDYVAFECLRRRSDGTCFNEQERDADDAPVDRRHTFRKLYTPGVDARPTHWTVCLFDPSANDENDRRMGPLRGELALTCRSVECPAPSSS